MDKENVLLMRLGKTVLNIYFSGPSEKEMYRRVNKAVSDYLDDSESPKFTETFTFEDKEG